MTTAILPEIDEQTRDELQPPCDVQWSIFFMGVPVGPPTKCENPAGWVVHRTCHCGTTRTDLICDRCLRDPELLFRCSACGCLDQFTEHRTEPLR